MGGRALFERADLQIGQRLYLSVTAYDHCVRTELVQVECQLRVVRIGRSLKAMVAMAAAARCEECSRTGGGSVLGDW